MDVNGRTALVTGAARRVGKSIALALAGAGADVVVHYGRSADEAEATAEEARGLGVDALTVQADLARPDEISALFDRVEQRFGRLDVLVNSAASFDKQAFGDITAADWDRTMAVNLRAPFLCTQRAAHVMRQRGRDGVPGAVVNLADLSGVYPWKGYASHGVSKAGVLHLTRVAARELAPDVRVNAIVPGPILPPPGVRADSEMWASIGASVPLERTGEPGMIGRTVRFLVESDYITGAAIPVDGGEHLIGAKHH